MLPGRYHDSQHGSTTTLVLLQGSHTIIWMPLRCSLRLERRAWQGRLPVPFWGLSPDAGHNFELVRDNEDERDIDSLQHWLLHGQFRWLPAPCQKLYTFGTLAAIHLAMKLCDVDTIVLLRSRISSFVGLGWHFMWIIASGSVAFRIASPVLLLLPVLSVSPFGATPRLESCGAREGWLLMVSIVRICRDTFSFTTALMGSGALRALCERTGSASALCCGHVPFFMILVVLYGETCRSREDSD